MGGPPRWRCFAASVTFCHLRKGQSSAPRVDVLSRWPGLVRGTFDRVAFGAEANSSPLISKTAQIVVVVASISVPQRPARDCTMLSPRPPSPDREGRATRGMVLEPPSRTEISTVPGTEEFGSISIRQEMPTLSECGAGSGEAWRSALLTSSLTTRAASWTRPWQMRMICRSLHRRRRAPITLAGTYGSVTLRSTLCGLFPASIAVLSPDTAFVPARSYCLVRCGARPNCGGEFHQVWKCPDPPRGKPTAT